MNNTLNVMIIDINEEYAKRLGAYIDKSEKYNVMGCCCVGERVLFDVSHMKPDIIIIDIFFGNYNTLPLFRWVHENFSYSPMIIIHTLISKKLALRQTAKYGAKYFLKKPMDLEYIMIKLDAFTSENDEDDDIVKDISVSVEYEITALLHVLAVPPHIVGYKYLKDAIRITVLSGKARTRITKEIYPVLAQKWGVTASSVEKSMRHAIELAWNRCEPEVIMKLFGSSFSFFSNKPSNSEFIAILSDKTKLRLLY